MFLMPALLVGLLGISIPVVIHLLHRQRTQPVRWGAMQFLRVSPLQRKRKKKVEQWILMAVRMLALGVLALLLARPLWVHGKYMPAGLVADAPVDVAVVLDHSLSTGRASNGQTVFAQGVAAVDKISDQLRPGDTLSVILAEHKARPVNALPIRKTDSAGLEQLRGRLRQEKPGMTDCSIPEAISAARRLLNNGRNLNKLVIVISDQQRSNWHVKDEALWRAALGDRAQQIARTLAVHSFPIAPDADMMNVSVGQIEVQPAILGVNRSMQVEASVSNTGNRPSGALTARLLVNGKEAALQQVPAMSPKSASTVRFDLERPFTQPGSGWLKMSVNAMDGLRADNDAVAAANVLQHLPVLIVDGQITSAGSFTSSRFLQAAMQPDQPSLVQAKVIGLADAATARLDDYAAVVVNDCATLPSSIRDRLADYARSGHGLWFILGPRTQRSLIERDLSADGFFKARVNEVKNAGDANAGGLQVKDPSNPMVAVIAAGERNALAGAITRSWWSLKPADADTQVALTAGNGDPLIMERPFGSNRGLVVVWATSADGAWNNWNLMPNFVPLVHETLYHLASARMHGLENHGIDAGQPIEWVGPAKPAVQSVQITLPDNTTIQRPATFNNGRWLVTYPDTYLPGIYRLQFSPTEIAPVYYGVNIDRKELDATTLSSDDIDWLRKGSFLDPAHPTIAAADLPLIIRRENKGAELWGWLGGLLLAGLVFETYMTYRLIGAQKKVDVAGAGLATAHVTAA